MLKGEGSTGSAVIWGADRQQRVNFITAHFRGVNRGEVEEFRVDN